MHAEHDATQTPRLWASANHPGPRTPRPSPSLNAIASRGQAYLDHILVREGEPRAWVARGRMLDSTDAEGWPGLQPYASRLQPYESRLQPYALQHTGAEVVDAEGGPRRVG